MMKVYCRHKIHQSQKKKQVEKKGKKKKQKNKQQTNILKNKNKTFNKVKEQYFHQIIMNNLIYLCEYIVAYFVLHTNSLCVLNSRTLPHFLMELSDTPIIQVHLAEEFAG